MLEGILEDQELNDLAEVVDGRLDAVIAARKQKRKEKINEVAGILSAVMNRSRLSPGVKGRILDKFPLISHQAMQYTVANESYRFAFVGAFIEQYSNFEKKNKIFNILDNCVGKSQSVQRDNSYLLLSKKHKQALRRQQEADERSARIQAKRVAGDLPSSPALVTRVVEGNSRTVAGKALRIHCS